MDIFEFWFWLRDAAIYNHMQSEEGREYLDKCWCMEQTSPDRQRLRETIGKK